MSATDYTSKEIYDMVMLSSAYELLDRMPDVSHRPILITTPLPPPPAPLKPIVPKARVTKPKADPAAKAHKATAATAAAKETLRAAKAAEKAATKEVARLQRALAAAERKIATHASKPAKKV
jgi:hypothetical protein